MSVLICSKCGESVGALVGGICLDCRSSDFSLITKHDETAERHPAWNAFKKAMRGKHYGFDALMDAWSWFRDGWDAEES